jgi:signal transduction histidine kinase
MGELQAVGLSPVMIDRTSPRHASRAVATLGVVGALLCVAAVTLVAAEAPGDAAFGRALVEFLIVGVPIAVGLVILGSGNNDRFAVGLIGVGMVWSVTALTVSSTSILYTIGRLSTWLILPGVFYLLLAFPTGRVAKGLDRWLLGGMLAVAALLFFGTAPLVAAFPIKTLWSTCTASCPPNAVFVLDRQPAFLTQVVLVREWSVEVLWLGLFYSMFKRWRGAPPLRRRAMHPVFISGALLGLFQICHVTYRELGGPTDIVVALSSAWTLSIVAVCATFPLGLARYRTELGHALARLASTLRESDSPAEVRNALAAALHDPSLELLFRDPDTGEWQDADGWSKDWPISPPAGRAATTIGGAGDVVVVHDEALCDDRELLDGVAGIAIAARRHEQMASELVRALGDLQQSRRRIAEAAEQARMLMARDLHDGAQQRLLSLRLRIARAARQAQNDGAGLGGDLQALGLEVDQAIRELRSLAQGATPPVLADGGVTTALRELTAQAPLPVHITADGVTRHTTEIERALYFTAVEGLQNAIKHADGATGVWLRLRESDQTLELEIRDDGSGISPGSPPGQGMANMRERIESLGGRLTVNSPNGRGTQITAAVSVIPSAGAATKPRAGTT